MFVKPSRCIQAKNVEAPELPKVLSGEVRSLN